MYGGVIFIGMIPEIGQLWTDLFLVNGDCLFRYAICLVRVNLSFLALVSNLSKFASF